MKLKKIFTLIAVLALCTSAVMLLTSCDDSECTHEYGEWTVTVEQTRCDATGERERICTLCGEVEKDTIAAGKHSYGVHSNDNNANCVSMGTRTATCEVCGATDVEKIEGNAPGHVYKNGVCTVCNDTMTLIETFKDADGISVKIYQGSDEHYELDVVGSGAMKDYSAETPAPWYEYNQNVTTIHIYEGITGVGDYAFDAFDMVEYVFIDKGVKSIGLEAFDSNVDIVRAYIQDVETWVSLSFEDEGASVLYLADFIYMNGDVIKNLVIPEGVTSINPYAFYANTMLLTVSIPESLEKIGNYAFYNCDAIEEVRIESLDSWCAIEFGREYANPLISGKDLYVNDIYTANLVIPESITEISAGAFEGCESIKTVTLQSNLVKIGDRAFYNCMYLEGVTLGNGIAEIGEYAFYGCSSLAEITLPASVTSIGADAFRGCAALVTVTFEAGIQLAAIGADVFANCEVLATVNFGGTADEWTALGVVLKDSVTLNCEK